MSVKILFAGGCHLSGYLAGAEFAFPLVAEAALSARGLDCSTRLATHIPLHRPERFLAPCAEFSPDLVVLQVGHYELSRELSSLFRRPAPAAAGSSSSSSPSVSERPPRLGGVSRRSLRYRLRCEAKLMVDTLTGSRLIDLDAFRLSINSFAQAARNGFRGPVLMLSPLACADPITGRYRRRAEPFYREAALVQGFSYLDVSRLAPPPADHRFETEGYWADPVHLGRSGHQALGTALAEAIAASLPSRTLPHVGTAC